MLQEALNYISARKNIFPLKEKSKAPLIQTGFHGASNKSTQIKQWWGDNQYNIGLPTGSTNGIVVVDIDDLSVEDHLDRTLGEGWRSPVAATSGKGKHYYYRYPSTPIGRMIQYEGYKIDILGDGGYVVAPPSIHPNGGIYEWVNEETLLNTELLPELPSYFQNNKNSNKNNYSKEKIGDGFRHDFLVAQAGIYRAKGLTVDEILSIIRVINAERCVPPVDEDELRSIASSMQSYQPYNTKIADDIDTAKLITFERSDLGFAQMIMSLYPTRIMYSDVLGWFFYDNRWFSVKEPQIVQIVWGVVEKYKEAILKSNLEQEHKDSALKYAKALNSVSKVTNALTALKSLVYVSHEELNNNNNLFGVQNGVIDLKTGEFIENNPAFKITQYSPVNYKENNTPPERWIKFLNEIFDGNQEVIEFIQRALGYSMTGDMSGQVFFLLLGGGSNGKSVFLNVVKHIMGDYSYTTPFDTFSQNAYRTQSNDLASLMGKRFITASEANVGTTFDEGRMKSLTGGDGITARFLYKDYMFYKPICKIWLAANHPPKVKDDGYGFWRRVRLIKFPRQFKGNDVDKFLEYKLKDEDSEILNWMIEGVIKWSHDGLGQVTSIVKETEQYREEQNPIEQFLMSFKPNRRVSLISAFHAFRNSGNNHSTTLREFENYISGKLKIVEEDNDRFIDFT